MLRLSCERTVRITRFLGLGWWRAAPPPPPPPQEWTGPDMHSQVNATLSMSLAQEEQEIQFASAGPGNPYQAYPGYTAEPAQADDAATQGGKSERRKKSSKDKSSRPKSASRKSSVSSSRRREDDDV